jgi:hypothetical protein
MAIRRSWCVAAVSVTVAALTAGAGCAARTTPAPPAGQPQAAPAPTPQPAAPQGQQAAGAGRQGQAQPPAAPAGPDYVQMLVDRLNLDGYKTTLKGLTQFGDRREGTQRNRDAVDWIEAQLKSYGCQTERMSYTPPAGRGGGGGGGGRAGGGAAAAAGAAGGGAAAGGAAAGGAAGGGAAAAGAAGAGQQGRGGQQAAAGQGQGQGRGGRGATVLTEPRRNQAGGSTYYGIVRSAGVNNSAANQPNEALAKLNAGPVLPPPFPQVFCTKWGTSRRGEMYIIGAHMDGIGYGEAANDDGSGTALVMELARIFSMPDVTTDVSIRFALWNGEEGGLRGARAYVEQREKLQGTPNEPKWLGMIQHDMMMWDHGMPRADGTLNPEQRPEADFNIEWQSNSKQAEASSKLALVVKLAADKYTKNYPGTLGPHMTNTDSTPFMDIVPAISLRENERGMNTGAGWNPHWHQPTDLFSTFSDKDFLLGLNAAQATLSAIAQLTSARVKGK